MAVAEPRQHPAQGVLELGFGFGEPALVDVDGGQLPARVDRRLVHGAAQVHCQRQRLAAVALGAGGVAGFAFQRTQHAQQVDGQWMAVAGAAAQQRQGGAHFAEGARGVAAGAVQDGEVGEVLDDAGVVLERIAAQRQRAQEQHARLVDRAHGLVAAAELRIEVGDRQRQPALFLARQRQQRLHGADAVVDLALQVLHAAEVGGRLQLQAGGRIADARDQR